MKKPIAIFLFIIYGFTSIGATVHIHYCMSEYAGWSLTNDKTNRCGKCGMDSDETKGCCSDQQKTFKINIDQSKTTISAPGFSIEKDFYNHTGLIYQYTTAAIKSSERSSAYSAPPSYLSALRRHLLFCIFRI